MIFGKKTKAETKIIEQQNIMSNVDTSIITILPFDTIKHWVFKNNSPTDLTGEDLLQVESILNKCISVYNTNQETHFKELNEKYPGYKLDWNNFIIDLQRYKRQYVATTNSKGEKEVWLNCFCGGGYPNWKTDLVFVKDGGNCYFNLKINLTSGECYDLMVNGNA